MVPESIFSFRHAHTENQGSYEIHCGDSYEDVELSDEYRNWIPSLLAFLLPFN